MVNVIAPRGENLSAALGLHLRQRSDVTLSVGTAHRLFFFGADSAWEPKEKPWSAPTQWLASYNKIVEFMLATQGPEDVLIFSDGRSRAVRLELDKIWDKLKHAVEMWVIYNISPRLGRKVAMASDTRETLYISLPSPRTTWPVETRSQHNAVGETTTHASTYSGVPQFAWAAAPRVFEKDKSAMLGHEVSKPPIKYFDTSMGQPFLWNERRSSKFWAQVLHDCKVKVAIDLSPGSGQLARACLDNAISCIAVARNAEHASWLQNVLDRYVMLSIVKAGAFLHDADLAASIKELFEDVLDQLNTSDELEDAEPEDA